MVHTSSDSGSGRSCSVATSLKQQQQQHFVFQPIVVTVKDTTCEVATASPVGRDSTDHRVLKMCVCLALRVKQRPSQEVSLSTTAQSVCVL